MSLKVACGEAQDMKNSAAVHEDVALISAEPQLMKCGCVLPFSRLCFLNNFAATLLLDVTPRPFSRTCFAEKTLSTYLRVTLACQGTTFE